MSTKYYAAAIENIESEDKDTRKYELPLFPLPSKLSTFVLTFWSYFIMKSANKCFSLVQPILIEEEWFRSDIYDQGATGM